MVYWINAHRTWIEVADDNLFKEHIIARTDTVLPISPERTVFISRLTPS